MSRVATPKALLTAYQRWELDSFDDPKAARTAIVLPAAEKMEQIQQQAQQDGYATGYREGAHKVAAEAMRLQEIASALNEESQRIEQRLAEDLLSLALAISKQVMRQALKLKPELILAVINEVLNQVSQTTMRSQLVLNPDDAVIVRTHLGDQLARSGCEIVVNPEIQRGGCRIHTPEGDIDATLENRWQRVVAAIGDEHAWIE